MRYQDGYGQGPYNLEITSFYDGRRASDFLGHDSRKHVCDYAKITIPMTDQ